MQNPVPISDAALAILCEYPLKKLRSDMSFDEYTNYVNDWNIFNRVWAYNYTVRAFRENGGNQGFYQFTRDSERLSYIKGHQSHVSIYRVAATAGAFNNIP